MDRNPVCKLVVTGLASAAALFVNPFGARLVWYPFDLAFRQKLNISHVAEWVSVSFHDMRGKIVFLLIVTFLLTALFAAAAGLWPKLAWFCLPFTAALPTSASCFCWRSCRRRFSPSFWISFPAIGQRKIHPSLTLW